MKNIVASHSNIALDEINTVIEYEEMTNSFAFGSMEVLSWLVFLFGVINLINTTLSNQIARKQENSILRSIGLTQKQLCKMNICEGLCYALFATLATLIVGLPASIFACRNLTFQEKYHSAKFPLVYQSLEFHLHRQIQVRPYHLFQMQKRFLQNQNISIKLFSIGNKAIFKLNFN